MHRTIFIILLIVFSYFVLEGCDNKGLYYFPEELSEYLELDASQKEQILPKLKEIQEKIISFYKDWLPTIRKQEMYPVIESDSMTQNARQSIRQFISAQAESIMPLLRPSQQEKLADISFPELGLQELMSVRRARAMEQFKNMKGAKRIDPDEPIPAGDLTDAAYQELIESRTIYIGQMQFSQSASGKVSRGFPLLIKATLIDPVVKTVMEARNGQKRDSLSSSPQEQRYTNGHFQVKLTLSTYFHESYLELKRWIIFLETREGMKIETVKSDKNDQPLIPEIPDPFSMVSLNPEQWSDADTTSFMPGLRGFGMQMKHAYFTIYFPNTYDGQKLLNPQQQAIRLIFLDEIDGDERGEGTWTIGHKP